MLDFTVLITLAVIFGVWVWAFGRVLVALMAILLAEKEKDDG